MRVFKYQYCMPAFLIELFEIEILDFVTCDWDTLFCERNYNMLRTNEHVKRRLHKLCKTILVVLVDGTTA